MSKQISFGRGMHKRRNEPLRHAVRSLGVSAFHAMDRLLPRTQWLDRQFRLVRFFQANGRFPRCSDDPAATFNDFILQRMVRNEWTQLERACIDKQYAKFLAAAMCPSVKTSATKLVIPLEREDGVEKAFGELSSRSGRNEVAKPTHGSGAVLFLREGPRPQAIRAFCETASLSYYRTSRESQYKGLQRKIIVEEDLSSGGGVPADFKFFCSLGEVLFCQVDLDRFTGHRRRLVTTTFEPIPVRFAHDLPEALPNKPENFDDMLRIAGDLSRLFCFVRIDLYSIGGAVYFGEFTFAPEGGAGALSSEDFGIGIMEKIRRKILSEEVRA